ncbi:MAG: 4-alpha-glucanotransferase [Lachnospiraceae bacterium]|jgi:4-alpha-glucanotransferase|nr:4-alpha-glucanotransferase [Lachnospiraceae bacterium]
MRRSGILMPISALPSPYGIGAFSKEAYEFVDHLKMAGQSLWQILPLGPTGYGDSPYQSFSTFAGNPYYIDLLTLVEKGYLTQEECDEADFGEQPTRVDYKKIYMERFALLNKAYTRAQEMGLEQQEEYQAFVAQNSFWLEDYCLFMAIKNHFDSVGFLEWDDEIRLRDPEAISAYQQLLSTEVRCYRFQQYEFHVQWRNLKKYANQNGIQIIGDIPIYVALDSSDVWANPTLFQLDEQLEPINVAGCPPDAFSKTGQLWGNPLYRWEVHEETGYEWWISRIRYCFEMYDIVRIDHFRGFDSYWSIPAKEETAVLGRWEKGPGYSLFAALKAALGKPCIIAEDLGFLTDSVRRLLKKTGFPGMKVLQFAFDSGASNVYLPHYHVHKSVVYTGKHVNDSLVSWFRTLTPKSRQFARQYLQLKSRKEIHWAFIRATLASVADTAIVPMQDFLGLGGESRFNLPSTLGGNWVWRMESEAFTQELAERIYEMTKLYGRLSEWKSNENT